jgi:hypothetical protein
MACSRSYQSSGAALLAGEMRRTIRGEEREDQLIERMIVALDDRFRGS